MRALATPAKGTDTPTKSRPKKATSTPKPKEVAKLSESPKPTLEEQPTTGIDEVSSDGDLILVVEHELSTPEGSSLHKSTTELSNGRGDTPSPISNGDAASRKPTVSSCTYRVKCDSLRQSSLYFRMLLDPDKFGEGRMVADAHKELAFKVASVDDLPHITIKHVGRISPVKSIRGLMGDFLRVLHGRDMVIQQPPLANLANLCVVADRFDAIDIVRQYFKSKRTMQLLDGKTPSQAMGNLNEEKTRQRLLVGLFLDNPSWVWHASRRLILQGWVGHEIEDDSALWWDLPMGIEDEILFRRECILETIQSIQGYFLNLYSSRERQCKLGYDSSAECDIYQLGQMVRFFKKIGTLSLAGVMLPSANYDDGAFEESYQGDVISLIESIRQCPEYQIDKNHHHCGLRQRIMPSLEDIEYSLNNEVAINLPAWQESRPEYAWTLVKRPLVWKIGNAGASMIRAHRAQQSQRSLFRHFETRDMFMAKERIWS